MTNNPLSQPGNFADAFTGKVRPPKRNRPTPTTDTPLTTTSTSPQEPTAAAPATRANPTTSATTPTTAKPATTSRSRPQRPGSGKVADGKLRRAASVPLSLHEAAKEHCHSTGHTLTEMILLAVTAARQELPDLISADEARHTTSEGTDALFPDLVVRSGKEDTKPMTFYPTPTQLDILDALAAEVGAGDRSHLISVALREYLS